MGATYLINASNISHVGSRTAPDSSVAFEISNITKDVAHTIDRYRSARFIPGPGEVVSKRDCRHCRIVRVHLRRPKPNI